MAGSALRKDPGRHVNGRTRIDDTRGRLVAEALRLYLEAGHGAVEDRRAEAAARDAEGDLEHKIIVHAMNSGLGAEIDNALRQLSGAVRLVTAIGAVVALLLGVATAHAALSAPDGTPINFHWALLGIIGVETIVLFIWAGFAIALPGRANAPSLGGFVSVIGRRLSGVLYRGAIQSAVARAVAAVYTGGAVAKWSFGSITHGLWLAFLVGALAMSVVTLSVKQIHFVWQTTILSQETYLPATDALAALPRMIGFTAPTAAEIRASQWIGQATLDAQVSSKWAKLLFACLILYAIAPRFLLLAFCGFKRSRALRRWRLDLDRPGYQRLRERLMPPVRDRRIIEDDDEIIAAGAADFVADPTIEFDGPVALVALEIEPPATGWPPLLDGIEWRDLGAIEGREDHRKVVAALRDLKPGLVLLTVSLLTSPDRGIEGLVKGLRQATRAPMAVLLAEGERLAGRHSERDAAQRIADWRRVCASAEIPSNWAIPFEIDGARPRDRARLARLLGVAPP